jgi:lycopene beta-cyclase
MTPRAPIPPATVPAPGRTQRSLAPGDASQRSLAPGDAFDVVIVGGGLAGQLVAHALAAQAPWATVALVEGREALVENQTWCCHGADLAERATGTPAGNASTLAWFLPLVERRWRQHLVRFPRYERVLDGDYLCLRGSALARATTALTRRREFSLLTGDGASAVGTQSVTLGSGRTLRAKVVLDARGAGPATFAGRTGYQKFLGVEIEIPGGAPRLPTVPLLMDATVAQREGFRFFYVLPFSRTRFLVEETYFSDTPALDPAAARERVRDYLAERGVTDFTTVREEAAVLPMPYVDRADGNPLAIGYRGGFFHPATGYSLGAAAQVAQRIAAVIAEAGPDAARVAAALAGMRVARRGNDRFARVLNFLSFRLIPGRFRRDWVMSAVYRLSEARLARFYAGRATGADRLAMLLVTARLFPPAPLTQRPLLGENP